MFRICLIWVKLVCFTCREFLGLNFHHAPAGWPIEEWSGSAGTKTLLEPASSGGESSAWGFSSCPLVVYSGPNLAVNAGLKGRCPALAAVHDV